MSLIRAVKWFAIYILLTSGFTAITALGAFVYFGVSDHFRENYEFETVFFFFLLLAGFFCIAVGVVIIIRTHLLTFGWIPVSLDWILHGRHIRTRRKDGILMILVGLTLILVSITQLWIQYILTEEDATISGWDSQSSPKHIHCPKCGKIITHTPQNSSS